MKKIFTLFLLLIFSIHPFCLAFDSDEINQEENLKKINEISAHYKDRNEKIIKKAKKEINYQKALKAANYKRYSKGKKDPSNIKKERHHLYGEKYIEVSNIIELQDGDYILYDPDWKKVTKIRYALEFHADDSCMGVIIVKFIDHNLVFYEYRSKSIHAKKASLEHIGIMRRGHHDFFVYSADKKLKSLVYGDKIYLFNFSIPENLFKHFGISEGLTSTGEIIYIKKSEISNAVFAPIKPVLWSLLRTEKGVIPWLIIGVSAGLFAECMGLLLAVPIGILHP